MAMHKQPDIDSQDDPEDSLAQTRMHRRLPLLTSTIVRLLSCPAGDVVLYGSLSLKLTYARFSLVVRTAASRGRVWKINCSH